MKRTIYLMWLAVASISCSPTGKSEKAILAYMRDQTGSPELEIEFSNVQIVKQTVGDSIAFLQAKYERELKEKAEQIKRMEDNIRQFEDILKSSSKDDPMAQMFYGQSIEMSRKQLEKLNSQTITDGSIRYRGQDTTRVIATVVTCQMTSLVNPVLKAKQTKEGSFLLTVDESVCMRQLK